MLMRYTHLRAEDLVGVWGSFCGHAPITGSVHLGRGMDIRFAFDPDQSATFGSRLRFHFVSYIYNVATEIANNLGM